jgi:hypothetical protein
MRKTGGLTGARNSKYRSPHPTKAGRHDRNSDDCPGDYVWSSPLWTEAARSYPPRDPPAYSGVNQAND